MPCRRLNTGARQCKAAALASFGVFCGGFYDYDGHCERDCWVSGREPVELALL